MDMIKKWVNKIHQGESLSILKQMPSDFVNCIVTSPPYWALRNYGVSGQLGLEPTFQEYINRLCNIFDEAKRVLKKDGICFVNMGDTYSGMKVGNDDLKNKNVNTKSFIKPKSNMPDKCLCQIPSRFAIEMANRGWILRNEIIWCLDEYTKLFVKFNGEYKHLSVKNLYAIKNNGNIQILSQNMEGENIWVSVKNIFNNNQKKCLKITTKTGKEIIATLKHKFVYKVNSLLPQVFRKIKTKEAKQLNVGEYLYSNDELKLNISTGKREDYNRGFVVGFYLAEGSYLKNQVGIYKNNIFSLSAQKRWGKNKPHIKKVGVQFSCGILDLKRGYIDYLKKYDVKIRRYGNSINIQSRDKILLNLILKFVSGDLCDGKHLTQKVFNQSKNFMIGIVDGFLAGDGHLDNKRYVVRIKPNYALKDDLLLLCRILGYDFRFCSVRAQKCQTGFFPAMTFTIRKVNYRTRSFGCTTDRIESIEKIGIKNVYDIEIEPYYTSFCGKGHINKPSLERRKDKYNHLYFLGNGIWTHNCKSNCMPSSAKDRFTVDFEKVFFFVKNKKYWFKQQFEKCITGNGKSQGINNGKRFNQEASGRGTRMLKNGINGKNKRCVWKIPTQPFSKAHFATFPGKLIIPMIKAGCPSNGVVLDLFMGAGTTTLVSRKLNRNYVGIELNPEYIKIAEERILKEYKECKIVKKHKWW